MTQQDLSTHAVEEAGQARRAAEAAARSAGVTVEDVADLEALTTLSDLFDRIWGRPQPMVGVDLLRALAHAGNQTSAALLDGRIVGGTVAFLGRHPPGPGPGAGHLHSHITGTTVGGKGIGFALKQHQRHWALARGIEEVRWTFDPLVRRNGVFNLVKLGARIIDYEEDFYGAVEDEINAGEPTDRAVACWRLREGRAVACSEGRTAEPDIAALRGAGAAVALDQDALGAPAPGNARGERLLVRVPADIEGLRGQDPALAVEWQTAVRETLGAAVRAGYRTTGMSRDGFYVLARETGLTDLAGRGPTDLAGGGRPAGPTGPRDRGGSGGGGAPG